MDWHQRLLRTVLHRGSDAIIRLSDPCARMVTPESEERIRRKHHTVCQAGVVEIVNLQGRGGRVRRYQVRQVRQRMLKYCLLGDN